MTTRIAGPLVALGLALQSVSAQGRTPQGVPNEASCPRCTITVRVLATLGTDDGPGSLKGKPMSVNVDSRGRYWVFEELEPPSVFNSSGRFERAIGRQGSGPGEFRSADNAAVVGDSMLVFDWLESRATMVGPDLKPGRTMRTHRSLRGHQVLEWPGLVIASGYMEGSSPPSSTLHRLSFDGPESRFLGSFGPVGTGGPMGNAIVGQHITRSRSGIWSAYWSRPEFTRWNRAGEAVASFRRELEWYPGTARGGLGSPTTAPEPRTGAIGEDGEGLVWLFIHRPAPTWKDAWPALAGRGEVRTRDIAWDKLYHTYVEVIDPVQGRVVARRTISGFVFETFPGNRAALYRIDDNGIPRLQIASLSVSGR